MHSEGNEIVIDGMAFSRAQSPGDEAELSALMGSNCASRTAVVPMGGGTQLHLGNPPRRPGSILDLSRMNRIVAHEAEDLLVTVQAGCSVASLQETLKRGNQWIPLDMPADPRATIGGLVATNSYGPLRLKYGRLRDYILGIRVVQADGTVTKAGGRVVKNVSGYDLCRLYAGSLGWLGVFTEFHLKTLPLPESQKDGWIHGMDPARVQALGQRILDEGLDPSGQLLMPYAEGFLLGIRFAGHPEAVSWQWSRVCELARSLGDLQEDLPSPAEAERRWLKAAQIGYGFGGQGEGLLLKIVAPYGQTALLVSQAEAFANRTAMRAEWVSYAAAHVLWVRLRQAAEAPMPVAECVSWLTELRRQLRMPRGELVLVDAPTEVKHGVEVWGVEGKPLELMCELKRKLDPYGILNPGRFVGRL